MLKRILAAHEQWFDVRRGYEYAGRIFPGYAEFHSYGEKYVLVKSAKLWEVDTHEYLFFVLADALDETQVRDLVSFMEHDGLKKVVPKPNHMSSAISLVIVADSCPGSGEGGAQNALPQELRPGYPAAGPTFGWPSPTSLRTA